MRTGEFSVADPEKHVVGHFRVPGLDILPATHDGHPAGTLDDDERATQVRSLLVKGLLSARMTEGMMNSNRRFIFCGTRVAARRLPAGACGLCVLALLVIQASPALAASRDHTLDATATPALEAPDATALIDRVDQHMRGRTQYAEMTMKVIRPDWSRETSMKTWAKGRDYSLVLVTAPARDKGTAFLKRENEIWNWLPSVGRVIKIAPSMMLQSWMGSDFTNDDLVKESSIVNDYTHEILGAEELDGQSCWKMRLTPLPEAAVVWGSVLVWVKKDEPIELRVEFYDEDGDLVNVQTLSEIRELGGRRIPTVLTMTPVDKPGQSTVLTFDAATFDEPIDDSFFSEQQMKRIH